MSAISPRSKDCDIRSALRARLRRQFASRDDVVVVEELPVCWGTVRADLAVLSDRIEGIEIKSAADDLNRLPRQVKYYGEAFERMTLVTATRHLDHALDIIPGWWAVLHAEMVPNVGGVGSIRLRSVRRGQANPGRTVEGVATLLERDELVGVLARLKRQRGWCSKPAFRLVERIVETLSLEEITAGACLQLKLRAYLEQHHDRTAFGRTAFGGGIARLAAIYGPLVAAGK